MSKAKGRVEWLTKLAGNTNLPDANRPATREVDV